MESIDLITLVLRWIHLASAVLLVGGAVFVWLVMLPAARRVLDQDQFQRLSGAARAPWATVVYVTTAGLLISGLINFIRLAVIPKVDPMPYHALFSFKVLAALVIFFIASALVGRAKGFARMREKTSFWLFVVALLAGVVVLLSGILNQIRT